MLAIVSFFLLQQQQLHQLSVSAIFHNSMPLLQVEPEVTPIHGLPILQDLLQMNLIQLYFRKKPQFILLMFTMVKMIQLPMM